MHLRKKYILAMVNVRVRRRSASEDKTQNGSDRSGKALDESHLVLKLKYAENDAEYKKGSSETD